MKRTTSFLYTAGLVLFSMMVFGQMPQTTAPAPATPVAAPTAYTHTSVNYIRTWRPNMPLTDTAAVASTSRTVSEVSQSTQYFDGLGLPLQTVVKGTSPASRDLVTPMVYDALGREQFKYLPYVPQSGNMNDGKFKTAPFAGQSTFYNDRNLNPGLLGDTVYYSRTDFETSPLNRPLNTFSPGNSWAKEGGNRPVKNEYHVNTAADSVRIWLMPASGTIPTSTAIYGAGQLFKTITTDEQGNQQVEFKDKNDLVILKKIRISGTGTGHVGWLCTYYVYDNQDNLRFVIPPLAVEKIIGAWSVSTAVANGLCFQYQYDHRNRMIEKRVPGAGPVHMVYDLRDRLAFTQDSVQRAKSPAKEWLVTFFDGQNRAVMTALYPSNSTRSQLQAIMDTTKGPAGNPQPNITGHQPITYTYYDDYSYAGAKAYSTADTAKLPRVASQYPEPLIASPLARGMLTGVKVLVLGTGQWLLTTQRYDAKGRLIQTLSDNLQGGQDMLTTRYDFSGKVLSTYLLHTNPASVTTPQTRVLTKHQYDHAGRLIEIRKQLNDNTALERIVASMTYDELGQLKVKKLGSANNGTNYIDQLAYEYMIRGWLKSINKGFLQSTSTTVTNWFGQELSYDRGYTENQYNGNIAGIKWKSGTNRIARSYGYRYDPANRMTSALFTQQNDPNSNAGAWVNSSMDFTVSHVGYDANGNILRMAQKGRKNNLNQWIDQLKYEPFPNSNQLRYVRDTVPDPISPLGDFKETAANQAANLTGTDDYVYDGNGNLVKDANKDITSISYNHLNLPQRILVRGKGIIDFTYDATGTKLRKRVTDSTATAVKITTTDYMGGLVYEKDTLQFISHEEGRIRAVFKTGQPIKYFYDYFEKDHLGNVRLVLTEQPDTAFYLASMETKSAAKENALFSNIETSRSTRPVGYPEENSTTRKNDYVAKLNSKNPDGKIGPSIVLQVMAGDTISIGAKAFYKSTGPVQKEEKLAPVSDMATALVRAFGPGGNAADKTVALNNNPSPFNEGFVNNEYQRLKEKDPGKDLTSNRPRAYLNFVLFDDEFKMVEGNSGVRQVQARPDEVQVLGQDKMVIEKNGFLYVYTSNETPEDVYFDEIMVVGLPGPVLEETHYYPFGLTMSGISMKAPGRLENKYKYNGIEKIGDLGLEDYDAKFRELDPQIGRWNQIDPKIESMEMWSPYASNYDNPIRFSDFLGDEPEGDNDPPASGFWSGAFSRMKDIAVGAFKIGSGYAIAETGMNGARAGADAANGNFETLLNTEPTGVVELGRTALAAANGNESAQGALVVDALTFIVLRKVLESKGNAAQAKEWKGPIDYSKYLKDGSTVGPGKKFTPSQLAKAKEVNKTINKGKLRSDLDGSAMNPSKKAKKGEKADMNQVEGDHKKPRKPKNKSQAPGTNSYSNLQLIPKKDNLKKSNN